MHSGAFVDQHPRLERKSVRTSVATSEREGLKKAVGPIAVRYRRANNLIMKGLNKLSLKLETASEMVPDSIRRTFEDALRSALESVYDIATKTEVDPNRKIRDEVKDTRFWDRILPGKAEDDSGAPPSGNLSLDRFWDKISRIRSGNGRDTTTESGPGRERLPARILSALGLNRLLAIVLGSVSGFFGPMALIPEMPVTVGLIFREIRSVAITYGFDPNSGETRKHCLAIFGSGTILEEDNAADLGFLASRYFVHGTTVRELISRFIPRIVSILGPRFLSPPVIGAAVGAGLNGMYISYFTEVAHVYFQLLNLEDKGYDPSEVREEFLRQIRR